MSSLAAIPHQTNSERFYKYFQTETSAIQEQVDRLADPALIQSERKNRTDQCLAKITRLASEVADASGELPSYDQRTYNEAIKTLQDKLIHIQATLAPKSKFSFKSKKNATGLSIQDMTSLSTHDDRHSAIPGYLTPGGSAGSPSSSRSATPAHLRTPNEERPLNAPVPFAAPPPVRNADEPFSPGDPDYAGMHHTFDKSAEAQRMLATSNEAHKFSISSHSHQYVTASSSSFESSLANQTCIISSLELCVLNVPASPPTQSDHPGSLASLTLNDITSSLLLLTRPISGPAHITSVRNSIILLSCRQFRMHDCENVDVYLFCYSRPIIEGCHGIRFARMPDKLFDSIHGRSNDGIGTENTQPKKEQNLFDQVDDFKWLKAESSPNWTLMKSTDAIPDSIWDQTLSAQPDVNVSQMLSSVGLPRNFQSGS